MSDREKIVNAFVLCRVNEGCLTSCPYWDDNSSVKECTKKLATDVYSILKEQEPVKPEWSNGKAFCGKCGKPFPRNRGEQRRFCSYCGHEVKWDDD